MWVDYNIMHSSTRAKRILLLSWHVSIGSTSESLCSWLHCIRIWQLFMSFSFNSCWFFLISCCILWLCIFCWTLLSCFMEICSCYTNEWLYKCWVFGFFAFLLYEFRESDVLRKFAARMLLALPQVIALVAMRLSFGSECDANQWHINYVLFKNRGNMIISL